MEIKTQKDGEKFFRDLRIFKALDSGRQISGVAAEFCVSENTARSAYNRIKILQMNGSVAKEEIKARRAMGLFYNDEEPYVPSSARTSHGVRFTPL